MSSRWLGLLLVAGTAHSSACARPAPPLVPPIVLPFELRHDLVVVTVSVNGRPAPLILDTGAGAMLLDSAFASDSRVDRSSREAQMNGRPVPLGTARSVTLGPAALTDVMVVIAPIDAVQARVGRDVRGVIGADVFERYVVTVDYSARTITLSEPASFVYRAAGHVVPLHIESRLPVVDASIVTRRHGTLSARLHFDLGSSGYALRFGKPYAIAHDLAHDTTTITGPFSAEVTGASDGDLLRLPAVHLGDLEIRRPSVALSHESIGPFGDQSTTDGTIGEHVFGRMRVTIDYSRARLMLEPIARLDVPDSVDASGLTLDPERKVLEVVAGSAGDVAGVRAGDRVLAIDGRPSGSLSSDALRDLLRTAGRTRHLTLERGPDTLEVTIALHMII